MSDQQIIDIFRDWLRHGQSGCHFASHAAGKSHLDFSVVPTESGMDRMSLDDLTSQVDLIGRNRRVAISLFPRIRTAAQLGELVSSFQLHERWSLTRVAPDEHDVAAVAISFRTRDLDASIAMGFAPMLEMPVTRRAPYVALALWAGPKSNPFFDKGPRRTVNMAHAWHPHTKEVHDNMWATSKKATKLRLSEPPFAARWLYDVSFCLPADAVDALLA